MSIAGVTRELLVRYLEFWTPSVLHAARRATFAQAWTAGEADPEEAAAGTGSAEAAFRVFAEFADRLRGRRLSFVLVAPQAAETSRRLDALQHELRTPADLSVHAVAGAGDALLPVALKASGAAGAPLLAYVETPTGTPTISTGRPAELLLVTPAGGWEGRRRGLHDAGFPLTTGVELVEGDDARLVVFATSSGKSLEAFKNALWAVDEYAGVRYRDPGDPDGHLLDISLSPHPGPLRRELLAHLGTAGERSVAELRRFTLTETVYRASDTTRALTALLSAGAVTRRPEHGRLAGDVVIAVA